MFSVKRVGVLKGKRVRMHIGFDDTDSTRRGCTTYIAALLVEELEKLDVVFLDYPLLIRLNPNVPWKTRGNGAICFRIEYPEILSSKVKEKVVKFVEKYSDINWKGTNPGIVFLEAENVPTEITAFSKKAETSIVTINQAIRLIQKFHGEALGYNTQRGIIGALAAIGETLDGDHTYELIAYRTPKKIGSKRRVDEKSILEMDQVLKPFTFNNIDTEKRRVIITPRGPDPILFGIRGENPLIVKEAFRLIKSLEPVERWVVFRSNQGTDAHLKQIRNLNEAEPYNSIIAEGVVSQDPKIVPVRHIVFPLKDPSAEIDCVAFEPTGELRKCARELKVGDKIEVYGAVQKPAENKPLTVNLEKIKVLKLVSQEFSRNPKCPTCGKRLKSMGKEQGFRCEKCRSRFRDLQKTIVFKERNLKIGLYITSTRSQRHLTKPLRRYGLEKSGRNTISLINSWHSVTNADH